MSRIRPVVIAGGPGARLWPLSDAQHSKPFLKLDGKRSLLDETLDRFADPVLFASPIVACAAAHSDRVRAALAADGVRDGGLILEPEPRDTAAAIAAIVAARLAAAGPDEILLIAPADHRIADVAGFRAGCAKALALAKQGRLVLFGATPTEPSTGFGYIEPAHGAAREVDDVASFKEKPDRARAESFIAAGCLWNMGMFLARASTFETLFRAHAPDIYGVASLAVAQGSTENGALTLAPEIFAKAEKKPFDRAVVELARGVAVVRLSVGWSDIGAWNAVWDALPHDAAGNAIVGDATLLDARGCLVHASGLKIAAIGVEGLAVVAVGDTVLVCPLAEAQKVRDLVEAMKRKG